MVNLLVGIGGTPSSVQQLVPMVPYMGSNQYFMTYSFLNLLYCTLIFEVPDVTNGSTPVWLGCLGRLGQPVPTIGYGDGEWLASSSTRDH